MYVFCVLCFVFCVLCFVFCVPGRVSPCPGGRGGGEGGGLIVPGRRWSLFDVLTLTDRDEGGRGRGNSLISSGFHISPAGRPGTTARYRPGGTAKSPGGQSVAIVLLCREHHIHV